MSLITAAWLCYAIGSNGKVLNNKIVSYLSGISMEIYLCHMMCFRAVEFLHIENFISNHYVIYWITCILTLAVAVIFSHGCKYYLLPLLEQGIAAVKEKAKKR
jgi:peptidoglycan/LPS O-acetylase OafA/YrhL